MQINYDDSVKEAEVFMTLAQKATSRLEELLGAKAANVTGTWDRKQDHLGRNVFRLRIQDAPDEAELELSPNDIIDDLRLKSRLYRLWGDVLQVRSHRYLKELLAPNGTTRNGHAS